MATCHPAPPHATPGHCMELLWGPRPDPQKAPNTATVPAVSRGPGTTLHYRVLALALLGLAMNVHAASRGRRQWALRYDGSFSRVQSPRARPGGFTVTLGLGAAHAIASAASCLMLLAAYLTARRWLSLPALLLTASDLLSDVSDAVVASTLLFLYSGALPALLYAAFASLVIALELFLWSGALRWYEQGLATQSKHLDLRLRGERSATTAASSVSSVMD